MNAVNWRALRNKMRRLLEQYGMVLYEEDGVWAIRDSNYDRVAFCAYPKNSLPRFLPVHGQYVPITCGGIG